MGEVRKGRQTPTQSVVLPYSSTYGAEAIDTVSYTHLDVYKRQAYRSWWCSAKYCLRILTICNDIF